MKSSARKNFRRVFYWTWASFAVLIFFAPEAFTSTSSLWQGSGPGFCVGIEINVGGHSDGGATENRVLKTTENQLSEIFPALIPQISARLTHYFHGKHPFSKWIGRVDAEKNKCYLRSGDDKAFWTEDISLEPLIDLMKQMQRPKAKNSSDSKQPVAPGATSETNLPMGISSWRGVKLRLPLKEASSRAVRKKIAADFILSQFHGGPVIPISKEADPQRYSDNIVQQSAPDLLLALNYFFQRPQALPNEKRELFEAIRQTLQGKPTSTALLELPEESLVSFFNDSDYDRAEFWIKELHLRKGYFQGGEAGLFTGRDVLTLFDEAAVVLPKLPSESWQEALKAARIDESKDDWILRKLVRTALPVKGEEQIFSEIFDRWSSRPTYDSFKCVGRFLLHLTFAMRPIPVADDYFLRVANLGNDGKTLPAGYTSKNIMIAVMENLQRYPFPLKVKTVETLFSPFMEKNSKDDPSTGSAAISALAHISWSIPSRAKWIVEIGKMNPELAKSAKEVSAAAVANEKRAVENPRSIKPWL